MTTATWFTRDGAPYAGAVGINETGHDGFYRGGSFVRVYTDERLAILNAARSARTAASASPSTSPAPTDRPVVARIAPRESKREAFEREHGALLKRVEHIHSSFVTDVVARGRARLYLSPKQVAALERVANEAEARTTAESTSEHIGSMNERIEVPVTVSRVREYEREPYGYRYRSRWGSSYATETAYITTMLDGSGNEIVTFSSSFRAEVGEAFTLRGTVSEHKTYNGVKQTIVKRAMRVEPKTAAPAAA